MPRKLEHEEAFYFANGQRHCIQAKDLRDKNTLELAKTVFLTDQEEQERLRPRVPKDINKRSHFYAPDPAPKRRVSIRETNPLHDTWVDNLLKMLAGKNTWTVVIGRFVDGVLEREPRFILEKYLWGKEVHRICSPNLIVRHDLFSQSPMLAMSIFRPWVAIEVINTHFPDEPSFNAMRDLSQRTPLIVFFDVLRNGINSYFLKVNDKTGEIIPLYYIYEGSVWKGSTERKDITTAMRLQIEIDADVERLRSKKAPQASQAPLATDSRHSTDDL